MVYCFFLASMNKISDVSLLVQASRLDIGPLLGTSETLAPEEPVGAWSYKLSSNRYPTPCRIGVTSRSQT